STSATSMIGVTLIRVIGSGWVERDRNFTMICSLSGWDRAPRSARDDGDLGRARALGAVEHVDERAVGDLISALHDHHPGGAGRNHGLKDEIQLVAADEGRAIHLHAVLGH